MAELKDEGTRPERAGSTLGRWFRPSVGGFAAWAIVYALLFAGVVLHRSPLRIPPAAAPEVGGSVFPEAAPDAAAWLLLPDAIGASAVDAAAFDALPAAAAWGNCLLQEVGSLGVLRQSDLTMDGPRTQALARASVVVVPAELRSLPVAARSVLANFARDGGVVIYDLSWPGVPDVHLARGALDRVDLVTDDAEAELRSIPLQVPRERIVFDASWETLATFVHDGRMERPAIAARRIGDGGEVAITFPFAETLLRFQQGTPDEDFSIPPRHREAAGVSFMQPSALITHAPHLTTFYPHADALERLVMAAVEWVRPIPRLWYFPYAYDGAYTMSHDDESFGDLSRAITDEEVRQGYRSTMYIVPENITDYGVRTMAEQGTEISLHWWRGWSGNVSRRVNWLGWKPFEQTLSLPEQLEILSVMNLKQPVTANRVHGLIWDADYTRDFRRLEAAGIRLDSTYGPSGRGQLGYVFGTGFPYHPIDRAGRPFQLVEMPFLFQDDENWFPTIDDSLLTASRDRYHQVICPLYHCTTLRWKPSVDVMEGWLNAADRARSYDHWVVPQARYHAFWNRRATGVIARGDGNTWHVASAPEDSLALMIPESASLSTTPWSATRVVEVMGRRYRLVLLDALPKSFSVRGRGM